MRDDRSVTADTVILCLVIVTALAFDFTNGFHDTANAMATSIATNALRPKVAVALSGVLNLIGAFLSVEVALTVTNAVVRIQSSDGTPKPELLADGGTALLLIVLAGLVGGIVWNLVTWLLGLPSSSSHALFGGLIGAAIAGLGVAGVNWTGDGSKLDGVVGKVILPALMSPVIAGVVAAAATWLIFKMTTGVAARFTDNGFRWGQIGSASLVSLAHGTNDVLLPLKPRRIGLVPYRTVRLVIDDDPPVVAFRHHQANLHGVRGVVGCRVEIPWFAPHLLETVNDVGGNDDLVGAQGCWF
jgi:PiT family inorganic phosphate transporter